MARGKKWRSLCAAMAICMAAGSLAGCGGNAASSGTATVSSAAESAKTDSSAAESAKTDSSAAESVKTDSSAAESTKTDSSVTDSSATGSTDEEQELVKLPPAAMSTDISSIDVPNAEAEVSQELKLTVDGNPLEGTLTVEDIELSGAFANMKVDRVSNDEKNVTLTVSGVPVFSDEEGAGFRAAGIMTIDGKFFSSEAPVRATVPVFQRAAEHPETALFYPFLDAVVDQGDALELHIILQAVGGSFKEGFGAEDVTLGGDFENAGIESLAEAEQGDYALVVNAPLPAEEDAVLYGTLTLAKGTLINADGSTNEEEISYTREYSKETEGRDLSKEDLKKIKDIVHPQKTGFWAEMETSPVYKAFNIAKTGLGYYNQAMSTYKTVVGILQTFGIIKTPPSMEEKILASIEELKGMMKELNENISVVRSLTDKNTQLLRSLQKQACEDYLASFNEHYYTMISLTDEVEAALVRNSAKIEKLADAYQKTDDTPREVDDPEIDKALTQLGAKICKLKANNYSTIGQKLEELDRAFKSTVSFMKNEPTNPINRYIQIHSISDNFSTTALTDKVLYALDIESQLDRTLSLLVLLDGEENEQVNIQSMQNAYFPDPEEGATLRGYPYCYLMELYVRPVRPAQWMFNSTYDSHVAYFNWEMMEKGAKKVVLSDEDIAEFGRRMNGRTMWDEMKLAGFDDSELSFKPWVVQTSYTIYSDIVPVSGIGFKFENVRVGDVKDQLELYDGDYLFGNYLDQTTRSKVQREPAGFRWVPKGKTNNAFAIISTGVNYKDNSVGRYVCMMHTEKLKEYADSWGMIMCDPQITLCEIWREDSK